MNKCIIIFLSSIALTSCNSHKQSEAKVVAESNTVEITDSQYKNIELATGKLEEKKISIILKLNGKIDVPPQNIVSISVPLGGYLKSTQLLPGMHIKKGESIATMEDQQYIQLQQDYLTTKAKLIFAEKEFGRQKELNESKSSSDKVFQQSQADYSSLKVQLKSLSEKLKLININPEQLNENTLSRSVNIPSPIEGFVSKVNVNIGKYVTPTDVLFELVNPTDIHLMLIVFEKDIDKLTIGQRLFAYTNTHPEKKYPCEIILIGKDFSNDKSVVVHCHFDNYDKSLIPGMYMNADVEVKTKQVNAVPSDAVINFEGKNYVFIVKAKNKFEMLEIKTGNSENGFTEICSSELLQNKTIVVKGAYQLLMANKNKEE